MCLRGYEFCTNYLYFKVVLYIYFKLCKQTRGEMCNFEDCLIYIGLGNIFQPPVFILWNVACLWTCSYYLIKQTSNHLIAHYWQKGKIWNTGRENKLTFIINICPSGYLNVYAELRVLESDSHLAVSCYRAFPGDPPPAHSSARSHSSHSGCWAGPASLPFWESRPFSSVWERAEFGWGASL